jgi:hypothetical protein
VCISPNGHAKPAGKCGRPSLRRPRGLDIGVRSVSFFHRWPSSGWQSSPQLKTFVSRVRRRRLRTGTPVGSVRFGDLRRLAPISRTWGVDRGLPIDRRGETSAGIVEKLDVLHVQPGNDRAIIIGDLTRREVCGRNSLSPLETKWERCWRRFRVSLKHVVPGLEVWAIAGVSRPFRRRDLRRRFPPENVTVDAYGNVRSATAFLHGIAAEELRPEELDLRDPCYEVLIAIRAVRGEARQ